MFYVFTIFFFTRDILYLDNLFPLWNKRIHHTQALTLILVLVIERTKQKLKNTNLISFYSQIIRVYEYLKVFPPVGPW